ncbi:hypothetical protein BPAE_0160g00260 [Botrytis paeoniae]|uniref:Uncharacterized protein n=1 Tax=Botrytis paeoniae TaxID=278948 RepID=A0A4Z1FGF9_9HELO|nr:hypothetical protein BPAE_0160g00260 [Botrytis paeoniae]
MGLIVIGGDKRMVDSLSGRIDVNQKYLTQMLGWTLIKLLRSTDSSGVKPSTGRASLDINFMSVSKLGTARLWSLQSALPPRWQKINSSTNVICTTETLCPQ